MNSTQTISSFSGIGTSNYVGIDYASNIGLPIFLFIISIASFGWFVKEVKKKRLHFNSMIAGFTLNIIYTVLVAYILIVTSLQIAGFPEAINLFDGIAHHAFGFTFDGGKEGVLLLIFAFISYILIKTLRNSIKVADLQAKVDALNKHVAIIAGKVNKSNIQNTKNIDISKLPTFEKKKNLKSMSNKIKNKK